PRRGLRGGARREVDHGARRRPARDGQVDRRASLPRRPRRLGRGARPALTRHLLAQAEEGVELDLPEDAWLVARLFPVLQRVPAIGDVGARSVDDPHSVRRRAFAALRAIVARLAERLPVVVFIDDAQWGDVDSATLLLELVRPPSPPPLLLVMTYRDKEAQTSPFLS